MKYLAVIFIAFVLVSLSTKVQAQNEATLSLKSNFWSNKFYKGDTIYSINAVLEELAANEQPYNLMIEAKRDNTFAQIIGAAGGLLIGWPLGQSLGESNPQWFLAGIGAGLIAISIPLSINFKKKANNALKMHNQLIYGSRSWHYKPTYNLGISVNKLGLKIQF